MHAPATRSAACLLGASLPHLRRRRSSTAFLSLLRLSSACWVYPPLSGRLWRARCSAPSAFWRCSPWRPRLQLRRPPHTASERGRRVLRSGSGGFVQQFTRTRSTNSLFGRSLAVLRANPRHSAPCELQSRWGGAGRCADRSVSAATMLGAHHSFATPRGGRPRAQINACPPCALLAARRWTPSVITEAGWDQYGRLLVNPTPFSNSCNDPRLPASWNEA